MIGKPVSARIYSDLRGEKVLTGSDEGDYRVYLYEHCPKGELLIYHPRLILHNDLEIANLICFLKACLDNPKTKPYRVDNILKGV